ncbi:unnamed protein product, partial [Linum tenue]
YGPAPEYSARLDFVLFLLNSSLSSTVGSKLKPSLLPWNHLLRHRRRRRLCIHRHICSRCLVSIVVYDGSSVAIVFHFLDFINFFLEKFSFAKACELQLGLWN